MDLILKSDRLLLRTFSVSEADILFSLVDDNREHLSKWFSWVEKTKTKGDVEKFLIDENTKFDQGKGIYLGIWNGNVLLGIVSLENINLENRNGELGYWLGESHVGKGIVFESCKLLIDYSFSTLKLHRIYASHITHNERSRHVIEKLKFTHEGTLREIGYLNGKYENHETYGLLESEWLK